MKKSATLLILLILTIAILISCEDGANSSISLAEAEAGVSEMSNEIDKAFAVTELDSKPAGYSESTSSSGDYATMTYTFNSVSYNGNTINGTMEMTMDVVNNDDMSMTFDITVNSITVDGSLDFVSSAPDASTEVQDITGSFSISGGSISSVSYDLTVTTTTDSSNNETTDVTGTITVDGTTFDASEFSQENLPG